MIKELRKEDLALAFEDTDYSDIEIRDEIVGQERAIEALRLGFATERDGYNMFVSGEEGTARLSAIKMVAREYLKDTSRLKDHAYAYNSSNPSSPLLLTFEKGGAVLFQKQLEEVENGSLELSELKKKYSDKKIISFLSSLERTKDSACFRINIILDRSQSDERPLIIVTHPSHDALFGFMVKAKAEHLSIRTGFYQQASGGYLVINANELVKEKGLYTSLKRYITMTEEALLSDSVKGELIKTCTPEPVNERVKVILTGSDETFDYLSAKDEMFLKLFKINPEFDYQMKRNYENIRGTVSYLKKISKDMLPLKNSAFRELLRYSSWFSENRMSLTTELGVLGDLLAEANLLAMAERKDSVEGCDVKNAILRRNKLSALTEEKINKEIRDGELLVQLDGKAVGVVNALAVMDRGLSSFGTPSVITATVSPGNEGIINIEHEAGLSGGIHDKGLLILEGYLRHRYARFFPLSLYAGICFEQSYAEIDGDSASSAELYALLSAIGEIPIRQDIAVTGSVNQMGKLQVVGAVNEKIEGFYNACKCFSLTGKQGVIIPKENISSLILPYEVEDAVSKGLFHIWAIDDIDEGFELLSGLERSERNEKGIFKSGSFNRIIEDRLKKICSSSVKN